MGRRRTHRLRAQARSIGEGPILLDGDPGELLDAVRADADRAEIRWVGRDRTAGLPEGGVRVAVVVVTEHGGRSGFAQAAAVLRDVEPLVHDDAVRVVVLQRRRTTTAPERVLRLLGDEVLLQVVRGLPGADGTSRHRTWRERAVLGGLRAAGLSVLRFA